MCRLYLPIASTVEALAPCDSSAPGWLFHAAGLCSAVLAVSHRRTADSQRDQRLCAHCAVRKRADCEWPARDHSPAR